MKNNSVTEAVGRVVGRIQDVEGDNFIVREILNCTAQQVVPNAAKAVDTNLDGQMVSGYRCCIEGWPSEASSGASTRQLGGNAEKSEITQSGLHNLIGLPML